MRPGEQHGVDYFFVSKSQFEEWIAAEQLLEHAVVYGEYKGIPRSQARACTRAGGARTHAHASPIIKLPVLSLAPSPPGAAAAAGGRGAGAGDRRGAAHRRAGRRDGWVRRAAALALAPPRRAAIARSPPPPALTPSPVRRLLPGVISIFLVAESEAELVERLVARKTESPEAMAVRAQTARKEVAHAVRFDYGARAGAGGGVGWPRTWIGCGSRGRLACCGAWRARVCMQRKPTRPAATPPSLRDSRGEPGRAAGGDSVPAGSHPNRRKVSGGAAAWHERRRRRLTCPPPRDPPPLPLPPFVCCLSLACTL